MGHLGKGRDGTIEFRDMKEPTGSSPLAIFLRDIVREVNANTIQPGKGYAIRRGTTGTILEVGGGASGGSAIEVSVCDATTGTVKRYRLIGTEVP